MSPVQWLWGTIIVVTITATGCSFKVGGMRLCILDHANLELVVRQLTHEDPNAP